jgi:23S rRNA pseudouridine1911/1915/1917 synthase
VTKKKILKAQAEYHRIDHFLNESFPSLSRSKIEKLIKGNHVQINRRTITKKHTPVRPHDLVEIEYPDESPSEIPRKDDVRQIEWIKGFEDDYLLVIDKPAGISVHPGSGKPQTTILDIFRSRYPQIESMKNTDRPGIVHRLDKDTSGVLILAKDQSTMKKMQNKFKNREIKKEYLALVEGKMRYKNGSIELPIARHEKNRKKFTVLRHPDYDRSRPAVTGYSVLLEFNHSSFIRLTPLTGRTHQLRVHLSHQGNPILGDSIYGHVQNLDRLALHAAKVEFSHPVTGNIITVNSGLPLRLLRYIQEQIREKTGRR